MEDTMMTFKNDNLAVKFMTMDDIKRVCPMAFKTEPTNPNVSNKYIQANTLTVIEDLGKLGWYPTDAKQCRSKKGSSGIRSFHMISLQNPNVKISKTVTDKNGNTIEIVDSYPRIILTNSHDGMNSFKFMVGIFRLVCSNGLVLCSQEFENMSIRHINYDFETLRIMVNDIVKNIPHVVCTMNQMKNTILHTEQMEEIATSIIKIRKEIDDNEKYRIDEQTVMDILNPVRNEDTGSDLWTIFNICQEKMIKGGFSILNSKNKIRKQRNITSIKKDIEYNQKLWNIAMKFLPQKNVA